LIEEHKPDVVIIESTGAANPMETIDGVTEAAMYQKIDLRAIITVVDGPELLARSRDGKGRTLKLMKEQIRCATQLLLNKADKLEPEQLVEAQQLLRELNEHAPTIATVRCILDDWSFLEQAQPLTDFSQDVLIEQDTHACGPGCTHDHSHSHHSHHTHAHVMAYTHYWNSPVNSTEFEALLQRLPDNIYRAKGIVTFTDTPSRFLFQYAYRESDFMRIDPQGHVNDVAVFIGEHFNKEWLQNELALLEQSERAEA
jgi:G3E family GTPase